MIKNLCAKTSGVETASHARHLTKCMEKSDENKPKMSSSWLNVSTSLTMTGVRDRLIIMNYNTSIIINIIYTRVYCC